MIGRLATWRPISREIFGAVFRVAWIRSVWQRIDSVASYDLNVRTATAACTCRSDIRFVRDGVIAAVMRARRIVLAVFAGTTARR